jgi:hypothetical protein
VVDIERLRRAEYPVRWYVYTCAIAPLILFVRARIVAQFPSYAIVPSRYALLFIGGFILLNIPSSDLAFKVPAAIAGSEARAAGAPAAGELENVAILKF